MWSVHERCEENLLPSDLELKVFAELKGLKSDYFSDAYQKEHFDNDIIIIISLL